MTGCHACRCTDYHPETRPDLESEVLPALRSIQLQVRQQAADEEPPSLYLCPITQVGSFHTLLCCFI